MIDCKLERCPKMLRLDWRKVVFMSSTDDVNEDLHA